MWNQIKIDIKNYWLSVILLIGAMIILQYFFHSVCMFQIMFGIPCAACGMSRAFFLFLQGKWAEALQMHPLLPFVIGGIILFIFFRYYVKKYGNLIKTYGIILLVVSIVIYIYRMKLYFPNIAPMVYREDNGLAILLYLLGGE